LDNHETAGEFVRLFTHDLEDRFRQFGTRLARETDENYTSGCGVADEYQPAKITVFRQKNATFPMRLLDDFGIFGLFRDFRDSHHVVAGIPQGAHNREITAFVGQEARRSHGHQAG
jgi:hypothetical protein